MSLTDNVSALRSTRFDAFHVATILSREQAYVIPVREERNMHGEGCYLSVFFFVFFFSFFLDSLVYLWTRHQTALGYSYLSFFLAFFESRMYVSHALLLCFGGLPMLNLQR